MIFSSSSLPVPLTIKALINGVTRFGKIDILIGHWRMIQLLAKIVFYSDISSLFCHEKTEKRFFLCKTFRIISRGGGYSEHAAFKIMRIYIYIHTHTSFFRRLRWVFVFLV